MARLQDLLEESESLKARLGAENENLLSRWRGRVLEPGEERAGYACCGPDGGCC